MRDPFHEPAEAASAGLRRSAALVARAGVIDGEIAASRTHLSSGLGLAFASEVIAKHGGRLALDERAPSGTSFLVELPAA